MKYQRTYVIITLLENLPMFSQSCNVVICTHECTRRYFHFSLFYPRNSSCRYFEVNPLQATVLSFFFFRVVAEKTKGSSDFLPTLYTLIRTYLQNIRTSQFCLLSSISYHITYTLGPTSNIYVYNSYYMIT